MIACALHLVSVASLWSAFEGSLAASATTQSSVRPPYVGSGLEYDLDQGLTSRLSMSESRANLSLGYSPQLTLRGAFGQRDLMVMHSGSVALDYSGRAYRIGLTQAGSLGTQSTFGGLATGALDPNAPGSMPQPRSDLIPAGTETVQIGALTSALAFSYDWTGRWRSGTSASYSINGGRGEVARRVLPQTHTAAADLTTSYVQTRADQFGGGITLTNFRSRGGGAFVPAQPMAGTENSATYWTLATTANWVHSFRGGRSVGLTGGVVGIKSLLPGRTPFYSLVVTGTGTGNMELYRRRGLMFSVDATVSIGPELNMLTTFMQRRLQAASNVVMTVDDDLRVSVGADGSQTFPVNDPQAFRVWGGNATSSYTPFRLMDITAQFRITTQSSNNPMVDLRPQWIAGLGLTLRAPPLAF